MAFVDFAPARDTPKMRGPAWTGATAMLTDLQLAQILRNASQRKRALYLAPLNAAMARHQIDGLLRTAAFIAQLAHESGEF
ncbi:MAG: peptidoglycan-binding protein, partial [Burkholderiales bacterium]